MRSRLLKPSEDKNLWRDRAPLVLASGSAARRKALEQLGVPFHVQPAAIDERAREAEVVAEGGDARVVAATLAREKALFVSRIRPGSIVLGADQLVECGGSRLGKPASVAAAAEQLRLLRGRAHRLHSAVALIRDGVVIDEIVRHADMTMRVFSDAFLALYLDIVGEDATTSAGAYQVEGLGIHLFERIEGDYWTIVGLPLLPVLEALRREGAVPA